VSGADWLLLLAIGVCGLLYGSFLNVVALRWSSGYSIISPGSHCPFCKNPLRIAELIPLISWLRQRGRCRHCGQAVSPIYPLGELLCSLLFILFWLQLGPWSATALAEWLAAWLLISVLLVAFVADWTSRIIPDRAVWPALVLMLGLRVWSHGLDAWTYALAVLIMFALFWLIDVTVYKWGGGKTAFGGGDIKLFLVLAAALGWQLVLLCLFLASLFGAVFGLIYQKAIAQSWRSAIPFAPAIVPAAVISYLWGEAWLRFYFDVILPF
jgi:leader peptidase (prepilin peptidase)/N-methyltransferase